jgi:hypothetical protein
MRGTSCLIAASAKGMNNLTCGMCDDGHGLYRKKHDPAVAVTNRGGFRVLSGGFAARFKPLQQSGTRNKKSRPNFDRGHFATA